jgi:NDP-sugar pyrophosphorylase family protein
VFDLRSVIETLIDERALAAFEVNERFHDIGTPDALAETDRWLRNLRRPTP